MYMQLNVIQIASLTLCDILPEKQAKEKHMYMLKHQTVSSLTTALSNSFLIPKEQLPILTNINLYNQGQI